MTWAQFKESFFEKYFPQCVWDRIVPEFEQLKQGTMSVAEYETKFTELARYAPHMVDTEYKKARKFEGGLNVAILDRINVLKLPTFVGVLDRALMAESNIVAAKQSEAPATECHGKGRSSKSRKASTTRPTRNRIRGRQLAPVKGVVSYHRVLSVARSTKGSATNYLEPVTGVAKWGTWLKTAPLPHKPVVKLHQAWRHQL